MKFAGKQFEDSRIIKSHRKNYFQRQVVNATNSFLFHAAQFFQHPANFLNLRDRDSVKKRQRDNPFGGAFGERKIAGFITEIFHVKRLQMNRREIASATDSGVVHFGNNQIALRSRKIIF